MKQGTLSIFVYISYSYNLCDVNVDIHYVVYMRIHSLVEPKRVAGDEACVEL